MSVYGISIGMSEEWLEKEKVRVIELSKSTLRTNTETCSKCGKEDCAYNLGDEPVCASCDPVARIIQNDHNRWASNMYTYAVRDLGISPEELGNKNNTQ